VARDLDEFVELGDVLSLRVAVEQQCCVVLGRHLSLVQCFKIRRQVVNALCVQKLAPYTDTHR